MIIELLHFLDETKLPKINLAKLEIDRTILTCRMNGRTDLNYRNFLKLSCKDEKTKIFSPISFIYYIIQLKYYIYQTSHKI